MKFLFSSDFHSNEPVFVDFARTLAHGPYEAGILAGDLLDEWVPDAEGRLAETLAARQRHLQSVLESAGKPIFFVLGNHDVTEWPDSATMTNLHNKRVNFLGQTLVGYRWTRMDRYPDELEVDLPSLAALIDADTLLVTHSPPRGVLDGVPGGRFRFGLKTLAQLPPPRMHVFGHVHECPGVVGTAVNGAWPALRQFFVIDPAEQTATLVAPGGQRHGTVLRWSDDP